MSQSELTDRIVANYLQKRGYRSAENSLRQEAQLEDSRPVAVDDTLIANFVLFYNEDEVNNPKSYDQSYQKLVKWVQDSIDIYKFELRRVLYPIFVHCYLDLVQKGLPEYSVHFFETHKQDHLEEHGQDILRLSTVREAIHMADNELVTNFRNNKYGVKMCKYSFELLLSFLQDNKFMLILRLMNQYVTIQATSDKPGQMSDAEKMSGSGLIGMDGSIDAFNSTELTLGSLPVDKEFYGDIERALGLMIHSDGPQLLEEVKKSIEGPVDQESPLPEAVPLPPKKLSDIQTELDHLRDLRYRLDCNDKSLPSICCYTFHNTRNSLCCLKSSLNADYIAAGFSDSIIKLWSVNSSNIEEAVGHSGTVFSVDFSNDCNYLISGSEDKTIRLWSVQTKSNLVCYKGHNYPIFDVSFADQGFYFASASLDRTARLWSVDHLFPLRLFVGHLSDVDTVRFHPNCNYVVTGSNDKTCRMWDVQSGHCVRIFTGHGAGVSAVAVSPEGHTMASASMDNVIRLWDLGSGKLIKALVGHQGRISSLEFSKNGKLLASSGEDDSVRIWDTKTDSAAPLESNIAPETKKEVEPIKSFYTKQSPVYSCKFTSRNILIALSVFQPNQ